MAKHTTEIAKIVINGGTLNSSLQHNCIGMSLSASVDQVAQISIDFLDPTLSMLGSGKIIKNAEVNYQDFKLTLTNISTGDNSGIPTINIKCRPDVVSKLKKRTGSKVMKDVSPSQFVIAEAKAVGAKHVVQTSAKRSQVARDVKTKGEDYTSETIPSSWSTFDRLANELGYICFEASGTIYFGKPTWIYELSKAKPVPVTVFSGTDKTRSYSIPSVSEGLDSGKQISVSLTLPINRLPEIRLGRCLRLLDMPKYKGTYMITGYDVDLAGDDITINVSAETPINPKPQPPQSPEKFDGKFGSTFSTNFNFSVPTFGGTGHWPCPTRYQVQTKFGVKGSTWQAGFHTGADLPCPTGTPAYAVFAGTITGDNWGSAYGNHIVLYVPGKGKYLYAHLRSKTVSVGQKVSPGQTIGYTNTTGHAYGPHLHFEFRVSPYRYGSDARDPIPTLAKTSFAQRAGSTLFSTQPNSAADKFVQLCLNQRGKRYSQAYFDYKHTSNPSYMDCSRMVAWAAWQVGIDFPSPSWIQYGRCQSAHTTMSVSNALRTRGAVVFVGNSMGIAHQHVAVSLGNGSQVIEAANPSVGIRIGNHPQSYWSVAGWIPGMKTATGKPAKSVTSGRVGYTPQASIN